MCSLCHVWSFTFLYTFTFCLVLLTSFSWGNSVSTGRALITHPVLGVFSLLDALSLISKVQMHFFSSFHFLVTFPSSVAVQARVIPYCFFFFSPFVWSVPSFYLGFISLLVTINVLRPRWLQVPPRARRIIDDKSWNFLASKQAVVNDGD